jgi:hypothetical protein
MNELEQLSQQQLNEIEEKDFYRSVSVYNENGIKIMTHYKGRINEVLKVISESGQDVSEWKVILDD